MSHESQTGSITRRGLLRAGSATLATATTIAMATAQEAARPVFRSSDHHLPNETDPGPKNAVLEAENPDSAWSPETDSGTVPPFKYSFGMTRKRIEAGGWTRQVTVRELPISKAMAGVEMRLTAGGVRELHWHVEAEWAIMLYGHARITAVDQHGRSFVSDLGEGDLWLFPKGVPHSIQGLGPDGCRFLIARTMDFQEGDVGYILQSQPHYVENTGDSDLVFLEMFRTPTYEDISLAEWMAHTPHRLIDQHLHVGTAMIDRIPRQPVVITPLCSGAI